MTGTSDRLLTPSKITAWLDCEHYLTLRRAADGGTIPEPSTGMGSFARLLMDKGSLHERAYLDRLVAEGHDVFEVPARHHRETFAQWTDRVGDVLGAGYDVVYQLPLIHDGLRGVADFLIRIDEPSALGPFSYEPIDAKLARVEAKPGHVLQLCFYAEAIAARQGRSPERVHLHLGSGVTESLRLVDVLAYWRRLRKQLRRVVETAPDVKTVPVPCPHCPFCEFAGVCEQQWRDADALYFVADARSAEIIELSAAGVSTRAALAKRFDHVDGLRPDRLDKLRRQADLQLRATPGSAPPFERIITGDSTQRDRLPPPDDADVVLDYEGHPFWTPSTGLFFLFGVLARDDDGGWTYTARWAHDPGEEAAQARALIDWLAARHAAHPGMHAYHYNHTERSALVRLAAEHGADEQLLTTMVDNGMFVDVLDVVRHAVQIGVESYGLKSVELVSDFNRDDEIEQGSGAVVEYEAWIADRDAERLDRIARYNEADVRATLAVRDWLLREPLAGTDWRAIPELEAEEAAGELDELVATLMATGEPWKELLAHLLEYWAREGRAHRAQHLALLAADRETQFDHPEVIACLTFQRFVEPAGRQRDRRAVFSYPEQELGPEILEGSRPLMYPAGPDGVVTVGNDGADETTSELTVTWAEHAAEIDVMPAAMVVNDWVSTRPKPEAAQEVATSVAAGSNTWPAIETLLMREPPRFETGFGPRQGLFTADLADIVSVAAHLDRSVLSVQGPPGTGKTYTGAHIIGRLVAEGQRVGITAFSHNAIDNLIHELLIHYPRTRVLRQPKQGADPAAAILGVTYGATRSKWDAMEHDVIAGTSWLFARENMRATPSVDVLMIDEAGQFGLADAVAAMSSARNAVLLGDPLQLAQVSIAAHPGGAGASVLQHVLGDDATIPPDRGVFLDTTRRMHPSICEFISRQIYDGRLQSHPACALQSIGGESGLRWVRAHHTGCSTSSVDEAALVADSIKQLLGQMWTDVQGTQRPLIGDDVMVVAPYNDHVDLVRSTLDADPAISGIRVGTVDKFQGQEAPVVLFTMATSSAAEMPRTADFLFSRNRLNVAVSRARGLAYVVCTDELLDSRARNVDEMMLISTLCSFVESAAAL